MKPGRELDALIAERVMGLAIVDLSQIKDGMLELDKPVTSLHIGDPPPYSTSIEAAWEIVENIGHTIGDNDDPHDFTIMHNSDGTWTVGWLAFRDGFGISEQSNTAPHAICLAALKSIGYEFPQATHPSDPSDPQQNQPKD